MQGKKIKKKNIFMSKRTAAMAVMVSVILPLLLLGYAWFMKERPKLNLKADWTFVDTLIQNSDVLLAFAFLLISAIPFYLVFDRRKAQARDLVPIALMAAMCVVGRAAFALVPLPNFKPVSAIIIITGVAFGPEAGYLTGALAGFLSNFLFGQGPWTPWQMFTWGLIGFLAGVLYKTGIFGKVGQASADKSGRRKRPMALCCFGFFAGVGYGWVMNLYHLISYVSPFSWKSVIATYVSSLYFDVSHGICTALVLWFVGELWVRKLLRVKKKFGLDGEERNYELPPSQPEG